MDENSSPTPTNLSAIFSQKRGRACREKELCSLATQRKRKGLGLFANRSFCKLVPSAINCSAIPRTKSTKTDIFCVVALLSERIIKFDPDNSNCQGKLKLLRVIGVSSCGGFQQNDQKHLIMKSGFMLVHVLL